MTEPVTNRPSSTVATWDGAALLDAFNLANHWLNHHRDRVNALNVFPIPDGDTGTNMALTMNASLEAAGKADKPDHAGTVADRFAFGALMGARGNSGVILSQIFRGFAGPIADKQEIDGSDIAAALDGAREKAYSAVMRPVEGTMLTVIRVAAEKANARAATSSSIDDILKAALEGAEEALADTPNQLDILRQAGVVDAGGQGVVYIINGMYRYATGDTTIQEDSSSDQIGAEMDFLDDVAELHGEDPFGYCTNFMIFGEDIDFEACRNHLDGMGQSMVAVGDDKIIKVHIHTEDPGAVLSYALSLGYLDQVKIDNMSLQTEALTDQRNASKSASDTNSEEDEVQPAMSEPVGMQGEIGIIAVAAGKGLAEALTSMGANIIVMGGQTMNPSTEELYQAVEKLPSEKVIILPNNKNIILSAQQVTDLTEKDIAIVPSRSLPQGLNALGAFSPVADLETNVEAMTEALADVQSIEITTAVRDVELNGVQVVEGQLIGLVNGDLVASGADLAEIVVKTLASLADEDPELLTVFLGENATDDATEALKEKSGSVFPDAEIEVIHGGQPHYQYLISVE